MTSSHKIVVHPTQYNVFSSDNERIVTYDTASGTASIVLRDLDVKILRVIQLENSIIEWKRDYLYQGRALVGAKSPTQDFRLFVDHLGSVHLITNWADNRIAERNEYFPFGSEVTDAWKGTDEVMRYTGHERDLLDPTHTTDDLDYMHARHFNLNLARFLSIDPAPADPSNPQSWNGYAYVLNNPLKYTDPYGLEAAIPCDNDGADNGLGCFVGPPPQRLRFEDEITVTGSYVAGFDLGLSDFSRSRSARDIFADLARQPRIGSMADLLDAYGEGFLPCRESFESRFDRSMASTHEGLGLGLEVATGFGAKAIGGAWLAKQMGTDTALAYIGKQTLRILPGRVGPAFSGRALAGAAASSTLGGLLVEPAYRLGLHAGTAINVTLVEPCAK